MTTAPATLRPLRIVPAAKILQEFCGLRPEPLLTARLVGVAYAALIVGYAAGWLEAGRGRYPGWVVAMGIVSNGGSVVAAAVALATGDVRLDALRPFGFAAMLFAGLIAISLVVCHLHHRRQRRP